MAKSCCVDGCKAKGVIYFRFPNSRTRCKKWMEIIKLRGKPSYKSVVCSAHFHPDDYSVVRGKVRLKPKVLPVKLSEEKSPEKLNQTAQNSCPSIDNDKLTRSDDQTESRVENISPSNDSSKSKHTKLYENNHHMEENGDNDKDVQSEERHYKDDITSGKSPDSLNEVSQSANNPATEKDIEDILTYYYIKQNKEVAERQTEELNREKKEVTAHHDGVGDKDAAVIDLSAHAEPKPVFIEIAVDQDRPNRGSGSPRDCLMVLESVEVELDPNELMLPERESDVDVPNNEQPKEDPISLLTSSDDDDVIIQEPHIDTVDVTDTTDEDDVPLVKFLDNTLRPRLRAPNPFHRKNIWGIYQHICMQCPYTTTNRTEYQNHTMKHSTVILVCPKCHYSTPSKAQYTRHMKMHQEDRRFQCHLCDYKARHRISMVYHLKCHEGVRDKCSATFRCDKCSFQTAVKRNLSRHVQLCGVRKFTCDQCPYETKRNSDLRRHQKKHAP